MTNTPDTLKKPKAVIFDIGNVLIEWNPERFYDAKIGEAKRLSMFSEVDLHGMNDEIDRGGPFKETIYNTAKAYPKWEAEIRMWHDEWIKMASPPIAQSWVLLRALRAKNIPVFALTNFGVESFAYALTQYPELAEFDRQFVSGHLKTIKPDAEIYDILERESGLKGDALLFADDRADNIEAAKARGWHTHLFKRPEDWANCLIGFGLLDPSEAAI